MRSSCPLVVSMRVAKTYMPMSEGGKMQKYAEYPREMMCVQVQVSSWTFLMESMYIQKIPAEERVSSWSRVNKEKCKRM